MAESLKLLMKSESFDKITIKQITDGAGVIRVTFYNHFQDKYDLLGWIVRKQVIEPSQILLDNGMYKEALRLIFAGIYRDGDFYRRAARIEGQNSFREISTQCIYELLKNVLESHVSKGRKPPAPWLTTESLSRYYAQSMDYILMEWIDSGYAVPPEEVVEIYEFIVRHSLWDVLEDI